MVISKEDSNRYEEQRLRNLNLNASAGFEFVIMGKPWKELTKFDSGSGCTFCKRSTVDEFNLGKIYQYADIKVHYFCLLFATHLLQHGEDEKGLLGFLLPDIRKELRRTSRIYCSYCRKPGAACSCGSKKCARNFHFSCGLENNTFHTFRGTFRSFCHEHRIKPAIPSHFFNLNDIICVICQEHIGDLTNADVIYASCCNNLCFHKPCIQKMALNAGYFFKCPNCNDKKKFRNSMLTQGLYIPNEDARWETVPNSFGELYEQYNSCDAADCLCPSGKSYSALSGIWEIIRCNMCGSHGIHRRCGRNFIDNRDEWTCIICSGVGTSTTTNEYPGRSASPSRRASVYGMKNRKPQSRKISTTMEMSKAGQKEVGPLNEEKRVRYTIDGVRISIPPSWRRKLRNLRVVL